VPRRTAIAYLAWSDNCQHPGTRQTSNSQPVLSNEERYTFLHTDAVDRNRNRVFNISKEYIPAGTIAQVPAVDKNVPGKQYTVGTVVGDAVGGTVGPLVGSVVGILFGAGDRFVVGPAAGGTVGQLDGCVVGGRVGPAVGVCEGLAAGAMHTDEPKTATLYEHAEHAVAPAKE
jgi:outer membrane lipoprotein SlyB